MQVFKLCMKIIRKNLLSMAVYVGLFLVVSLLIASLTSGQQVQQADYTTYKNSIAFISEEESIFVDGLREELSKVANFVDLPDQREKLQDALFFRNVTYIVRIPEGFTSRFMAGEPVQVEKTIVPASVTNTYTDLTINQYLNTARLYVSQVDGLTQEDLVDRLREDLSISTPVEVARPEGAVQNQDFSAFFFNYLAYSLLSVLILGMSAIMLVFKNKDIQQRIGASPLSPGSVTLQLLLANGVFALAAWAFMVGICLIINVRNIQNTNILYFILSSFVFALAGVSISFLIANVVKSRDAVAAVSNIVALGSAFLSGVFVPQQFLGPTVLRIASFTPTYWYVRANNAIAELSRFDYQSVSAVLSYILAIAGFAVLFFAIALLLGRRRRLSY
jgi:ABC-2 type transport system permease protein